MAIFCRTNVVLTCNGQGIIELYEFQKKYPLAEAKVNAYLSQTGTYFQSYIRRGLSNLAAEDNDLRAASLQTPSSVPASPTTTYNSVGLSTATPTPITATTAINDLPSSSHPSSPKSSSPPAASTILQEHRQSFDLHRTSSGSGVRTSMHAGKLRSTRERTSF